MSGTSTCKWTRNSIRHFSRDSRGNIAPIFAIALLPILGFVGAAVDYTRANAARSSMQAAMDSPVLMVSKDAAANPTMSSQQITEAVQRYFSSLYTDKTAFGVTVSATYTPSTSSAAATILASGQGAIKTDFMKVAGFPELSFGTSSTSMGQFAHEGRDGVGQYRIDGVQRQDVGVANRREGYGRFAVRFLQNHW
jgi:Flp pilus assembly protein TadG